MATVRALLNDYSIKAPDVLNIMFPGLSFDSEVDGVLHFNCINPESVVRFLTDGLLDTVICYDKRFDYRYADGSTAKFVKSRKTWDIKNSIYTIAQIHMTF